MAERPPTLRQREGAWISRRGGQTPPLLLLIELPPSWPGQRLPPTGRRSGCRDAAEAIVS